MKKHDSVRIKFLFETKRYSDKQFDKAVAIGAKFEEELIAAVLAENTASYGGV